MKTELLKLMPSVRKYARKKVLTLKQFQDLVKWSYYKRRCRCILNGGAPTASNESAASASNEEVAETPAAPAAVSLEGDSQKQLKNPCYA